MQALSARCRAHINDVVPGIRPCALSHKHRAHILREDPSLHERVQRRQIVVPCDIVGVIHIGRARHSDPLAPKACEDLFLIGCVELETYGRRPFLQKALEHPDRHELTEFHEPRFDDPLRHRITDGIVPHRIALFTRILDLGGIAVDIPEDPVHKGFQPVEPSGLGDLHRLVNCR